MLLYTKSTHTRICAYNKKWAGLIQLARMATLQIPVQRAHTMWGKSREKKAARMYHTRNFGTGHVEPDEYYLSRIGLRGRKRWILLCSVVFGYLLVIGHFVVSFLFI